MITKQEIEQLTGKDATKLMTIRRLSDDTLVNLYDDFGGSILYNKMEGVDSVGESKNTYTEEYADAEQLRVYVPDGDIYNKATVIKLTLDFIGENRSAVKDTFIQFIKKGKCTFNDGIRERSFTFVFLKSSEPREDIYKGSIHYMEITFELQNISGTTSVSSTTKTLTYHNASTLSTNTTIGLLASKTDGYLYANAAVGSNSSLQWVKMSDVDMSLSANISAFDYNPYTTTFTYTENSTTTNYSYAGGKLITIL